jgi:hypothetical protein
VQDQDPVVAMHELANAIARAWEARPGSPLAEVRWDRVSERLIVSRVPGNEEFDQDILARSGDLVEMAIADAPHSSQELQSIARAVWADPDLPMKVYSTGPLPGGSGLQVAGEGDLSAAQRLFDARYGPGIVTVEPGRPAVPL